MDHQKLQHVLPLCMAAHQAQNKRTLHRASTRPTGDTLQVLCNAAKSDKARLQQLEVDVARLSHRAEAAERECRELQEKLSRAQVGLLSCRT